MKVIPPGSIIGILGGGQLGRMTALAAARLGYRCHIYCPDENEPAVAVSAFHTKGKFDNRAALEKFPKLRAALAGLAGKISEEEMRRLNREADADQRDVATVVREFRASKGL